MLAQDIASDTNEEIAPTDSLSAKTDSIKSNAIDAPVEYAARDSMIMTLRGSKKLYLFGESSAQYQGLELTANRIEINSDSSLIYATHGLDSIGNEVEYPIYKEGETQYEMKNVWYNFKTKKMRVLDVITQQGEGFVTAALSKKMADDDMFMEDGEYSTCDAPHKHFYLKMTRAKVRKGKNVVTGPAYLVVEDVPLPIAIPFGFFPFSKDYSSGILMPTYGDEMSRGFSLRDGGYYFAFNDYADLAVTGEIFTKGSWGANAVSRYRKKYKFSGSFNAGYLVTITGDKESQGLPGSDYSKKKDFRLTWTHSQDAKANPFYNLSGNVNFSTSSYDRNNLASIYSDRYSQNQKASSVSWRYKHPNSIFAFSASTQINQMSKDTTLSVTLPTFTVTMSQLYPFKKKEQIGNQQWYEKIYMSYSGLFANSISNVKEYEFAQKSLVKDWRNGIKHDIPVSASFNFKYITVNPSVSYTESWYTKRIDYRYNYDTHNIAPSDTTYGFYRVFNYSGNLNFNTKLYGMYKPWSIFGSRVKGMQIRHVLTPTVGFSGAPDFSNPSYGMYSKAKYVEDEKVKEILYSPFKDQMWGAPSTGKTGSMNFSLENNVEAKIPIAGTDSTKKVSLIDNLGLRMSYNFLADSLNWSNLSSSIRLKLGKSNLSLQGTFDTYLYNEQGRNINQTRLAAGKGIGRFMGTSTGYSYTLNNSVIKSWFQRGEKKETTKTDENQNEDGDSEAEDTETVEEQKGSLRHNHQESDGNYDSDGYLLLDVPWNLSFNYSLSYAYDRAHFNKEKREYPYKISQNVGISGNISPTRGWNFNFNTSYDFDYKKFAVMQCTLSREMHCWLMSASIIPIGPYQSYSFTIAVKSSLLSDLKYTQSSNYRDSQYWGY
ncbi:hypothetical protein FACS1894123_09710 [Bacteroidia bacterium]|nr:hypothetical protein FACS1894123_09710 [Bacteroidia bacterium]